MMRNIHTLTVDTQEPTATPTSSMGKQLLGAAAGAAIALGIYLGYRSITPHLTAYLSIPQVPGNPEASASTRISHPEQTDQQKRLASRARAIAERYSERPVTNKELESKAVSSVTSYQQRLVAIPSSSSSVSSSISSAPAVAQVVQKSSEPMHAGASPKETFKKNPPKLPSSGVGVWLSAIFAFLFAVGFFFRSSLNKELSSITLPRLPRCIRKRSR